MTSARPFRGRLRSFNSGSLGKIGTGTLTLSGASTYGGGTTVTEGTRLVTNLTGSATGTGPVQVSGGTIGGGGTVSGSLTIGTGSGIGSVLDPAATDRKIVTLVSESSLSLLSDATYRCTIDFKNSKSTAVRANGVGGLGKITFLGNAMVGSLITITNQGGAPNNTGVTSTTFTDNASAGAATIVNGGATNGSHGEPGITYFMGNASAATSTLICQSGFGGGHFGAFGGSVRFEDSSTAANAIFQLEGGTVADATGGYCAFYDTSTAGDSVFTVEGSDVAGSGSLQFYDSSSAGNATLIVNGGLYFYGDSTGGTARVELFGSGTMNAFFSRSTPVTIGSLEGDGVAMLGYETLIVGSNSLSTTFSGLIEDSEFYSGGALVKIGTGTLTLSGANTYTGGTTVDQGTLLINNQSGSGTGSGSVQLTGGTLGGSGIISGEVAVGTGSGTGSFLAPAAGTAVQTRLTIESAVTLNSDATYTYTFKANAKHARTDLLIANGVTINGATLAINATTQGRMKRGLVLNVISNTSASPISGTFTNLLDGGIVNVNGNNLQADYQGGDGNDLTLTVVP